MLPFVLRKIGADPASASAPLVATLVDVSGIVIYLDSREPRLDGRPAVVTVPPMFATRVYHYRDPAAVILGLKELRKQGLTPRGLLFVALDPRGETYIAVPEDLDAVANIRVGDKLSLVAAVGGPLLPLRRGPSPARRHACCGTAIAGSATPAARPRSRARSASGSRAARRRTCSSAARAHVPGSWWTLDHLSAVVELHSLGFLDCVVTDDRHPRAQDRRRRSSTTSSSSRCASTARPTEGWTEVFTSEMGNILLVERRVLQYRLVLTCERGLVEIDVSHLPDLVIETARVPMRSGFGVVGRIDGGAFAVTAGTIEPWGLTNMTPAMLVGSPTESLLDLPKTLRAMPLE